jgi:hypothetical protein
MCKNRRKLLNFVALLLLSVAPAFAAQVPGEVSPAEALRARVLLYYGTLQKGAKTNALELVAPESKNDFFQMNYDGLVKFRVLDVQLADAGDAATVRLLRTDHFSNFPAPLDRETVDHWKRIDDQWYILLPDLRWTGPKHTASYASYFVAEASDHHRCEPTRRHEGSPKGYVGIEQRETRRPREEARGQEI